jgi:hypothetical protein
MQLSQPKPSETSLSLIRRNPDTFRQKKKQVTRKKTSRNPLDVSKRFVWSNFLYSTWFQSLIFNSQTQRSVHRNICVCVYVCARVCEHTVRLTDQVLHIIYSAYVETYSLPHPTSYTICNSGYFLGSKAAGACRWSLTSIQYRNSKCVVPHLQSTICFNSKQRDNLPLPYFWRFPHKQSAYFYDAGFRLDHILPPDAATAAR